MTREELREKIAYHVYDALNPNITCEQVADAIMNIVVDERREIDWDKVPDENRQDINITKVVPVLLAEKVTE
jgi:hypothetical protein